MRREERLKMIAQDCVHFKGNRPCRPHLHNGAVCRCEAYSPRTRKILIIELSSPTRVVQTSAFVRRLKADTPQAQITFITNYPELLASEVDVSLSLDAGSLVCLQMDHFDVIYNFDLDRRACAITNQISADVKKGFYLRQGHSMPLDEDAYGTYLETIFPGVQPEKTGTMTPVQELFYLAGLDYQLDKPRLDAPPTNHVVLCEDEIAVGLFTGLSKDHPGSVFWPESHWQELTKQLLNTGVMPLLLGGPRDDGMNRRLSQKTQATYPGSLDWRELRAVMALCEVVVTVDHAAAALAGALGKQVIQLSPNGMETVTRDMFRGYGQLMHPAVTASFEDMGPEQVYQAVIARITDFSETPAVKAEVNDPADISDLINLISSRGQTARTRVSP